MPDFNQTGPAGQGPMTGQGRGSCNGRSQQGNFIGGGMNRGMGRGRGCCRFGMRQGRGQFFQDDNVSLSLEEQEELLKKRLELVQKTQKDSKNSK